MLYFLCTMFKLCWKNYVHTGQRKFAKVSNLRKYTRQVNFIQPFILIIDRNFYLVDYTFEQIYYIIYFYSNIFISPLWFQFTSMFVYVYLKFRNYFIIHIVSNLILSCIKKNEINWKKIIIKSYLLSYNNRFLENLIYVLLFHNYNNIFLYTFHKIG